MLLHCRHVNRPARSRSTFPRRAPRGLDIEGQALWVVGEPLGRPEVVRACAKMATFLYGAQGFWGSQRFSQRCPRFLEVPTVLLLRYRYCSKSPVFLSSEYTSTFRFVFRPTASCERMRSCVSLWATAASRPHTEKCPGFIGGACVFCLVLWPIDREPRAPSRKVPQAAEYHKPSRRVPIVGPRFLKVPTVFSEMPKVFEGANGFLRDARGF